MFFTRLVLLGVASFLSSCAPTTTAQGNVLVVNTTAFGPSLRTPQGELRRVARSALFDLALPGEPYIVTDKTDGQQVFAKAFSDPNVRCISEEHLVWLKGDGAQYAADVSNALKTSGYLTVGGRSGTNAINGAARFNERTFLFTWTLNGDTTLLSICRSARS